MNTRRDFLKKLFGIGAFAAASTLPTIAKEKENVEYTIDEMFDVCKGNGSLFYLKKDSWLNKKLGDLLGDRLVDRKYFKYYCPLFNILIPIKETYTEDDFNPIFYHIQAKEPWEYYCGEIGYGGKEYGVIRMYKDEKKGFYTIDMFAARNPKNPY